MESLGNIRERIDSIDQELVSLFLERMQCSEDVLAYKLENDLPIFDPVRERAKVANFVRDVPKELKNQAGVLIRILMEISRAHQHHQDGKVSEISEKVRASMIDSDEDLFSDVHVACQGKEGSYAQQAASRLFKRPTISYFNTFEGVIKSVEQGFCDFGVLPIENSSAGSVNQVYDLMIEHNLSIIKSLRMKVDHALLALPGTKLEELTEIASHEQALSQCSKFLNEHPSILPHPFENTAAAAEFVVESGRHDLAAVASKLCADIYKLDVLADSIQDQGNNYTRFACIANRSMVLPGADRTSLSLHVSHEPGSLFNVLARFQALDINLTKLESRPLPNRDFEFMFYFDIECGPSRKELFILLDSLHEVCESFRWLGTYSELI